jgi:hypothetical protein
MWLTNTQLIEPELYSPSIFDIQQSVMCIAYVSCIKKNALVCWTNQVGMMTGRKLVLRMLRSLYTNDNAWHLLTTTCSK